MRRHFSCLAALGKDQIAAVEITVLRQDLLVHHPHKAQGGRVLRSCFHVRLSGCDSSENELSHSLLQSRRCREEMETVIPPGIFRVEPYHAATLILTEAKR